MCFGCAGPLDTRMRFRADGSCFLRRILGRRLPACDGSGSRPRSRKPAPLPRWEGGSGPRGSNGVAGPPPDRRVAALGRVLCEARERLALRSGELWRRPTDPHRSVRAVGLHGVDTDSAPAGPTPVDTMRSIRRPGLRHSNPGQGGGIERTGNAAEARHGGPAQR